MIGTAERPWSYYFFFRRALRPTMARPVPRQEQRRGLWYRLEMSEHRNVGNRTAPTLPEARQDNIFAVPLKSLLTDVNEPGVGVMVAILDDQVAPAANNTCGVRERDRSTVVTETRLEQASSDPPSSVVPPSFL